MKILRGLLGQVARLLVRIARSLDGGAVSAPAAPPRDFPPDYMADLRRRFPAAPAHWLEALAERQVRVESPPRVGEPLSEASPAFEPPQRSPDLPAPDFARPPTAASGNPEAAFPEGRDARAAPAPPRAFAPRAGRPEIRFPRPEPKAVQARRAIPNFKPLGQAARPAMPALRTTARPARTLPSRPESAVLRIRLRDRAPVFPSPSERAAPPAVQFPSAPISQRPSPAFSEPVLRPERPAPAWPESEQPPSAPAPVFDETSRSWPELPPVIEEVPLRQLGLGDDAEITIEQVIGTWSA